MKTIITVFFLIAAFFAPTGNAHAGAQDEKLKQLTVQLQSDPNNTALREEIIKLALAPASYEPIAPTPVTKVMATAAPAAAPVITREQIQDLVRVAMSLTAEGEVPQGIAVPLGLTQPGVPYITRRAGFSTDSGTVLRNFRVHVSGKGTLLFTRRKAAGPVDHWLVDLDGTLLSAGRWQNGVFTSQDVKAVKADFEAEMRLWVQELAKTPIPPADPGQAK